MHGLIVDIVRLAVAALVVRALFYWRQRCKH